MILLDGDQLRGNTVHGSDEYCIIGHFEHVGARCWGSCSLTAAAREKKVESGFSEFT